MFTCDSNEFMRPIHHRMPVILDAEGVEAWLDPSTSAEQVLELLQPARNDALMSYPVSRAVGNIRNQGPELVDPFTG